MKILDIIRDLLHDAGTAADRYDEFYHDNDNRHYVSYTDRNRYHGEMGLFIFVLPNLFGFCVGMAFAKLLSLSFTWYMILGVVFAVLCGAMKNHLSGLMSFKLAVIRNAVTVSIIAVIVFVFGKMASL